jgi:hypothetical protein
MIVALRRWWKGLKESSKFGGWRYALWREIQYKPVVRQLHKLYWAIRHRTINRYDVVYTDLKPGYHDVTQLIVHANFCLLAKFVEIEFDTIKWDSDPEHQHAADEMKSLYKWWKEVYPHYEDNDPTNRPGVVRPEREFIPYKVDADGDPTSFTWDVKPGQEHLEADYTKACLASIEYEDACQDEIEANLIRLAKIRPYLWS